MTEVGANATLAYTVAGVQRAFAARCVAITYGVQMLGNESQSRRHRAFYPRQVVPGQFTMTFALRARYDLAKHKTVRLRGKTVDNIGEYEKFNGWLQGYMDALLAEDEFATTVTMPKMTISCPARNFFREGVALGPIQFGDQVGAMLWMQQVTFETTRLPNEQPPATSTYDSSFTLLDRNAMFFYPKSPQLSGQDSPLVFDTVHGTADYLNAPPNNRLNSTAATGVFTSGLTDADRNNG